MSTEDVAVVGGVGCMIFGIVLIPAIVLGSMVAVTCLVLRLFGVI